MKIIYEKDEFVDVKHLGEKRRVHYEIFRATGKDAFVCRWCKTAIPLGCMAVKQYHYNSRLSPEPIVGYTCRDCIEDPRANYKIIKIIVSTHPCKPNARCQAVHATADLREIKAPWARAPWAR